MVTGDSLECCIVPSRIELETFSENSSVPALLSPVAYAPTPSCSVAFSKALVPGRVFNGSARLRSASQRAYPAQAAGSRPLCRAPRSRQHVLR